MVDIYTANEIISKMKKGKYPNIPYGEEGSATLVDYKFLSRTIVEFTVENDNHYETKNLKQSKIKATLNQKFPVFVWIDD